MTAIFFLFFFFNKLKQQSPNLIFSVSLAGRNNLIIFFGLGVDMVGVKAELSGQKGEEEEEGKITI